MTGLQQSFQRLDYLASIDHPRLSLPDGKRAAVFLVVDTKRWDIVRTMPRQVLLALQGATVIPDRGVPHRIRWFERRLPHPASRPGTLFRQARRIMDWHQKAVA